ncbi:hypothetical protein FRC14_006997 [Serendipita sp. 396]|nr:hypothetical protein FRC14_006997 [Serendipita sp. 396]KAG8783835.1 hypothetical protein FRC15_004451 [Serendipita sp. 397]KAG8798874.1 hypothetical protein FRC16_006366 [Serendipita sp. 398]KAG8862895.1 hypothetical protein FRC20_010962 [Serendipita sp. 405]
MSLTRSYFFSLATTTTIPSLSILIILIFPLFTPFFVCLNQESILSLRETKYGIEIELLESGKLKYTGISWIHFFMSSPIWEIAFRAFVDVRRRIDQEVCLFVFFFFRDSPKCCSLICRSTSSLDAKRHPHRLSL